MSNTGALSGRDPTTGAPVTVTFTEGIITAVEPGRGGTDAWLSPGLIDLQVNGYAGLDLNDGALTPDTVVRLAERLARAGVTTFAPTLITAAEPALIAALRAIATARETVPLVAAMVPFVHVEGPAISREDGPRGAHPLAHVRPPDLAEFHRWRQASSNLVGLVTLSPEWPEAPEFIAALARDNVLVAIGHTAATPTQITAAVDAGASLSTHLGNGIAALLPRHPNAIWTQLADDRLTASFIADGHHLPADTLKAMLRAKSLERAILVSDAAALGAMPPGRYTSAIGGEVEVGADGRLSVAGTSYLAGAGHLLAQNVATLVNRIGLTLAGALRLATENPGAFAGGRGRLEPGARADLMRFHFAPGDPQLTVERTIVAGMEIAP